MLMNQFVIVCDVGSDFLIFANYTRLVIPVFISCNQLSLFLLLHSMQSIWQFSATVFPPFAQGVMWSASISSI